LLPIFQVDHSEVKAHLSSIRHMIREIIETLQFEIKLWAEVLYLVLWLTPSMSNNSDAALEGVIKINMEELTLLLTFKKDFGTIKAQYK